MSALLQFMYQGVVNVKHSELPIFMKIAASLQIKGLTAHEDGQKYAASVASPATAAPPPLTAAAAGSTKDPSPTTSKRSQDQDVLHETYPIMPKRRSNQAHTSHRMMAELLHQVQTQQQNLRSAEFMNSESTEGNHGHGHGHSNSGSSIAEDVLMPAITLSESSSRFHLGTVKREEEAVDNNSVTSVATHNNNGSERAFFASPLKIEFGGGGSASDLQAVTTAAAMSYHMNRQGGGLSTSPQAYKFDHSGDLNLTGNTSNDEYNKSSMNHMVIPTGERRGRIFYCLSIVLLSICVSFNLFPWV